MDAHEKVALDEKRLGEFELLRKHYRAVAESHKDARLNRGDDTPYYNVVLEEMLADLFQRSAKLEERLAILEGMIYPENLEDRPK